MAESYPACITAALWGEEQITHLGLDDYQEAAAASEAASEAEVEPEVEVVGR
ncbi:MAG TPA: hypothetical protein VFI63_00875 [Solirubrobacterales bacterium]|nr:hypothetical protein [Solirubrobacterales bacterium]